MNSDLMIQYIEYVADKLLVDLNCDKIYKVSNPFGFMELISMRQKQNMFEGRISEYARQENPDNNLNDCFN